jgi:hypothetical protein
VCHDFSFVGDSVGMVRRGVVAKRRSDSALGPVQAHEALDYTRSTQEIVIHYSGEQFDYVDGLSLSQVEYCSSRGVRHWCDSRPAA